MVTKRSYFIHFISKKFPCKLGLGHSGYFSGVGVCVVSFPPLPKAYFLLSPVFLSEDDDANTLSTRSMSKSGLFQNIEEHIHDSLRFSTKDGAKYSLPFFQKGTLDFLKTAFHVSSELKFKHPITVLTGPQECRRISNTSHYAPQLLSLYLHLKTNHRPISEIQRMIDHDPPLIKLPSGFPKKLQDLIVPCPLSHLWYYRCD